MYNQMVWGVKHLSAGDDLFFLSGCGFLSHVGWRAYFIFLNSFKKKKKEDFNSNIFLVFFLLVIHPFMIIMITVPCLCVGQFQRHC